MNHSVLIAILCAAVFMVVSQDAAQVGIEREKTKQMKMECEKIEIIRSD